MSRSRQSLAYITAGAAGMYCGSCMHDNTLARALSRHGLDVLLIPTYTPIRTDEQNFSIDQVFFGGINVYLDQVIPGYRFLPDWITRWLDQPKLIRWATARETAINPRSLGALTVSMLRGTAGNQRREVEKLCRWLKQEVNPDLVILTNMLIAGCTPRIKEKLGVPVLVTLQGDDVFVEFLPEPYRGQVLENIRRLVQVVDGFLVHSHYYAHFMQDYFSIPRDKLHVVPLGIDLAGFSSRSMENRAVTEPLSLDAASGHLAEQTTKPAGTPTPSQVDSAIGGARIETGPPSPPTIGYFARLAPEKGLHLLVDAFIRLRSRPEMQSVRLRIAGWMGEGHHAYAEEQFRKLHAAGLDTAYEYAGSIDRDAKIHFLQSLDLLCVPTVYREPKGLFVLEALAAGIPVLQPDHGAFPELISATGGGKLFPAGNVDGLSDELARLILDRPTLRQLGRQGQESVYTRFHADAMAEGTLRILKPFLGHTGS